jgi:hypothetical protein
MAGLDRGEEGRRPLLRKSWEQPNRFIVDGKGPCKSPYSQNLDNRHVIRLGMAAWHRCLG